MKGKHISGLDCSAPAEQMIPHVLLAQAQAMGDLRKKALDWKDPEGVHDMRVLSRRLRSAIRDFEAHMRKPALPGAKLRNIARRLGSVRDQDVAINALEKLKTEARGDVADGIALLIQERAQQRELARAALETAISPSAIREFGEEFANKVEKPLRVRKLSAPESPAPETFARVGVKVISARLKELRDAGPNIFFPTHNNELHELRILAKRLRYAIELFSSCGSDDMKAAAREVAQLQTSLGELHDCDVWIEDLGRRLKRGAKQHAPDRETFLQRAACAWLLKHFAKLRTEHYRDALERWEKWDAAGFLRSLRSLITPS